MSATYQKGQVVRLSYHGQEVDAVVMLASPNSRSLMLRYYGTFSTPSGGMMIDYMPLLMDDDGVYRDLVENAPATLTP